MYFVFIHVKLLLCYIKHHQTEIRLNSVKVAELERKKVFDNEMDEIKSRFKFRFLIAGFVSATASDAFVVGSARLLVHREKVFMRKEQTRTKAARRLMSHKITRLAEPRSRELAIRANARARIHRKSRVGLYTNFTAFPRAAFRKRCCCNTGCADLIISFVRVGCCAHFRFTSLCNTARRIDRVCKRGESAK